MFSIRTRVRPGLLSHALYIIESEQITNSCQLSLVGFGWRWVGACCLLTALSCGSSHVAATTSHTSAASALISSAVSSYVFSSHPPFLSSVSPPRSTKLKGLTWIWEYEMSIVSQFPRNYICKKLYLLPLRRNNFIFCERRLKLYRRLHASLLITSNYQIFCLFT